MGNENSSPENQDIPPVTEPVQPPSNDREIKKKKQRKKNRDRSVDQEGFDTSSLDSAVSLPVPDNGSSFMPGEARGSCSLMFDQKERASNLLLAPNNLLFTGLDVNEDLRSQTPVISSLSNEGLCSNEESPGAKTLSVSPEVTTLENIPCEEKEGGAISSFLEWAEGTKDKRQAEPMPLTEYAKECAAWSLEDSFGELPTLAPSLNSTKDNGGSSVPDLYLDSGLNVMQSATTFAIRDKRDPDNSSSENNSSTDVTWMSGAGVAQTISSELDPLWQIEQLSDKRKAHVISLPEREGGGCSITEGNSQEAGFWEVGHKEEALAKPGGQDTDGLDSLLMKQETLIPNYPTMGGSDMKKYGAVVDGQSSVKCGDATSELNSDAVTSKKYELQEEFTEQNSQQSCAAPVMPLNPSNLSLNTTVEEKNESSIFEKEQPDQAESEKTEGLLFTEIKNHSVDLLVSCGPSAVSLLPDENQKQKASIVSENRGEQVGSNETTHVKDMSGGNVTLSDPENLTCFMKEDSIKNKTSSLVGSVRDFASENELTIHIKKENMVPEENKDVSLGDSGSQDRLDLASLNTQKEANSFQGVPLSFDIDKRQESPEMHWEDYCFQSGTSGKNLEADFGAECHLRTPDDHSPELSQGSERKKTAPYEIEDKSLLSAEAQQLQEQKRSQSGTLLPEGTLLNFPASEMTGKVCSADAHGSLMLHSENNIVMQNKRDESWEHTFSQRTEWELEGHTTHEIASESSATSAEITLVPEAELEHQNLDEWAKVAESIATEKAQVQEDTPLSESKACSPMVCGDADSVPVTVPEQSNDVDQKESNEPDQEEYEAEMKSQVVDMTLAQKPQSKVNSLQQAEQEQMSEENEQSLKKLHSGSPQASVSIVETGSLQPTFRGLHSSSLKENNPQESNDGKASLETLQGEAAERQQVVAILMPSPQVESKVSPESPGSICSNQQHTAKTELKDSSHKNLPTATSPGEQKHNETPPALELNQPSSHQGMCESERTITGDVLDKPQTVSVGFEAKPIDPKALPVEKASWSNVSESARDSVQDRRLTTQINQKVEESFPSKGALSEFRQEVYDSLDSESLWEEKNLSYAFAKVPDTSKQPSSLCNLTGSPDESAVGVTEYVPEMQKTVTANAEQPETLLVGFEINGSDDNYKSNSIDLNLPTEPEEKGSNIEINENPSLKEETTPKDESGEISYEKELIFTAAEKAGIQKYPPVSSGLTVIPASSTLHKTDHIEKLEFLPVGSQAELRGLSVPAFSHDQQTRVNQEPTNGMNDVIMGELQNKELEVTACQNILGTTPSLQTVAAAATPIHLGDVLAEEGSTDQRTSEVLNSDNIPSETVPEKECVIPDQGSQSEESAPLAEILPAPLEDSCETGQLEGSLSPFNFEKLQIEISAIKTKGAKSDVNFKAQQFDSSVNSLFSLSSLEEKLLSLSSSGKQAGCNEGTATNIGCVDDKCSTITESTGKAGNSKCTFAEDFSIPKMEIETSKQSTATSEKEQNDLPSRTFGIGFFDFRKHISKIFEKTVPSASTAELAPLSAETSTGEGDSLAAKEISECKHGLSKGDEVNRNREAGCDQTTEGCMLPSEAGALERSAEEKMLQGEKPVTITPEYYLPGAFSEDITIQKSCLSEEPLTSAPKVDCQVDSLSSSKGTAEECGCVSAISSDNDVNQVSLEAEVQHPVNSHTSETDHLLSGNEVSLCIFASKGEVLESDFDKTTMAEVKESNLISQCDTGLSKEELIHYGNQQHYPMPGEDKGNEENVVDLGDTSALPSLLDSLDVHQEQQPRILPAEDQQNSTCSDLLDENTVNDKVFMTPKALECTEFLPILVDAPEQEKIQDTAIHGLIDYLKNEMDPNGSSIGDGKPEHSSVSEAGVEETDDTKLSTIEKEPRISIDTPKTGITATLFTNDHDSVLQTTKCKQEADATKLSEAIQRREQNVCIDDEAASASQCKEEHLADEKSLLDVQEKGSTTSLSEYEQCLPSESQNMATDELLPESNFRELCHSLLAVPEKDSIAVAVKDTSNEERDDIRVESCSLSVDIIKQAPDVATSEQPLTTVLSDEHEIAQVSADLTEPRSSDSEEAFETPESTTPVKAAPPLPLPPPEIAAFDIEEQEVKPQLPPEDTGICSDTVSVTDVSLNESTEESPFHPPPHSFSTVFDEDKPIASSGTYNLDFDNIEVVDSLQAADPSCLDIRSRDSKSHVRRKSTDSVPVSRSTLSRSLSLQAGDFDGASFLGNNETAGSATDTFSTGSSSASSTLKRTKKPRPASLKKKQLGKKSLDVPPVKEPEPSEAQQDSVVPSEEKASEESLELSGAECTQPAHSAAGTEEREEAPSAPETTYTLDPSNTEEISTSGAGDNKVQNSPPASKKASPLKTAPEAVEVTPSDTGGQEDPPVKGLAVRLEFDYSEEKGSGEEHQGSPPLPKKVGKKPGAKMPLRKPKPKKTGEKLDNAPTTPTKAPADPNEIPLPKGSYTFDIDKWEDPNFNPFSSTCKMQESPKLPQQMTATYTFDPDMCEDSIDPFKTSSKVASSPTKSPASFEIPANASEINGTEGDGLNKPAKKKKTPLKTMVEDVMSVCSLFDTFRVKKSPKRSPLSDAPSQDSIVLPAAETPSSVVCTVVHATDEEKLASSAGSQKWTCMTVDLDSDKQDYPQPSDLSTFVNETKFSSPTEELEYGNSYEIEYMEKIGSSIPQDDDAQTKQSLYLMFDAQQESPVKSPPVRISDSTTPCSGSSLEETETQLSSGMKLQHPASRSLAASQESSSQSPDKSKPKELEPMTLGSTSNNTDITTPEDPFASADALLSRISHPPSMCDQLQYLEPDLAEKNPPIFAQKLQEELEFAAMRIEALKLARQITLSSFSSSDAERDPAVSADVSISKSALYSRISSSEGENTSGLLYQQQDLDSALRIAREEIVAKEREVSEWKEKYEESRREVMEMRKIVSEYEKTIAQMIEDEQREKSMSHHTVQQLIMEKEQALADLNSVEKSLADLFRRYEKMKEVLEGFRKNEEVLKKCAQEYLSRVKKEEQRYQALKVHAEEKLDRANAEIAQVRGKAQQEQAAYQASLRKEQLKVDALERTLEQKNKEIEELTKICDELIAKMGKS
ncbi:transforming acidic coiled-coil-containing protein 2 isoform X7 [Pogona vitticeps]